MKTARPRIFPAFCVLLLSAVALAWSRSERFAESVELVTPRGGLLISSHPGRLCACWPSPLMRPDGSSAWTVAAASMRRDDAIPLFSPSDPTSSAPLTQADSAQRPKFVAGSSSVAGVMTRYVEVPYWILLVLPAFPPIWVLGGFLRNLKRRKLGLCRQCGYDLRASPETCPECGTPKIIRRPWTYWPLRVVGLVLFVMLIFGVRELSATDWHTTSSRQIDAATLGGFPFNSDRGTLADIPRPLRQLDGQRIEVEGFMIPTDPAEEFSEFALVPFLPTADALLAPTMQQTIIVRTIPGKGTHYLPGQLQISGTLHVRVMRDGDYNMDIYDITDASVVKTYEDTRP